MTFTSDTFKQMCSKLDCQKSFKFKHISYTIRGRESRTGVEFGGLGFRVKGLGQFEAWVLGMVAASRRQAFSSALSTSRSLTLPSLCLPLS